MSPQDLHAVSQKSCSVLQNLGPQIQWVQSYVTGDKIYCIYIAPSEELAFGCVSRAEFRKVRILALRQRQV